MSRESIRPISKHKYKSLFTTSPQPPLERITDLQKTTSPETSLQLRSILAEFRTDGGDILGTKSKDPEGLRYHPLLDKRREAKHVLFDLSHSGLVVSTKKYTERIQRIEEELGLGKCILYEKMPFGKPRMVATVLEQYEEGEIDPQIMHKFNRERSRSNQHKRHKR